MKASDVKREDGKIVYRGHKFPGFNKPINAPAGAKEKKMVLAKKGEDVKLVRFGLRGMQDYTQHGSEKRRDNYRARSAGIRDKSGNLTKDDKFSANYWARKVLW
jgi:TFIIF-interacting CTD phosphatase-like protein